MTETQSLTLTVLKEAVAGHAAAFRCLTEYQPAGGAGDKVFPPTYEGGKYAMEQRILAGGEIVDCVLLDSVQSQANRMELALLEARRNKVEVGSNGTINLAMSKGITDANVVGRPGEDRRRGGLYCFRGVSGLKGASVTPRSPEITGVQVPEGLTASFTLGTAELNNGFGPGCPDGTEFGVEVTAEVTDEFGSVMRRGIANDFFMILYR